LHPSSSIALSRHDAAQPLVASWSSQQRRRELRRHRRFAAPPLQIALLDRAYRSADWSANGLAVTGYAGSLMPGRQIEATIRLESGDHLGALFQDSLEIVRNNPTHNRLSAKFPPRSWTGLKLLEQIIHRRIGADGGGGVAA
jgi:hypothetical protein